MARHKNYDDDFDGDLQEHDFDEPEMDDISLLDKDDYDGEPSALDFDNDHGFIDDESLYSDVDNDINIDADDVADSETEQADEEPEEE